MANTIDKKGLLDAMEDLCKWGALEKHKGLSPVYASEQTGFLVDVGEDQFVVSTKRSLVKYFYENLHQVEFSAMELYCTRGMPEVTLRITPKKELTGGVLHSDSFCLAMLGKGNKAYDGFVLNSEEIVSEMA